MFDFLQKWFGGRSVVESNLQRCDVMVASFPKCGRTWLRLLLGRVIQTAYRPPGDVDLLDPFKMADHVPVPRILFSHLGDPQHCHPSEVKLDPRGRDKKTIFLVRNPLDVVVSHYYNRKHRDIPEESFHGPLSEFVYEERGGIDALINYYNLHYRARESFPGFLLLRYEAMVEDTTRELRRAVDFIGLTEVTDEQIREAVEFARFDRMKKMEKENLLGSHKLAPVDPANHDTYKVRKGKVGGYRDDLAEPEIAYLTERVASRLDPELNVWTDGGAKPSPD